MKHNFRLSISLIIAVILCVTAVAPGCAIGKKTEIVTFKEYQIADSTITQLIDTEIIPFLEKYEASPDDWCMSLTLKESIDIPNGLQLVVTMVEMKDLRNPSTRQARGLVFYDDFRVFVYGPMALTVVPNVHRIRVLKKYDDDELPVPVHYFRWIYEKDPGENWYYVESTADYATESFLKSYFKTSKPKK